MHNGVMSFCNISRVLPPGLPLCFHGRRSPMLRGRTNQALFPTSAFAFQCGACLQCTYRQPQLTITPAFSRTIPLKEKKKHDLLRAIR